MAENNNFKEKTKEIINDVKDDSKSFDKKDIDAGKGMGILSYLGFLALIPYLSEKNNKYIIYHAKQGMNLFIIEIILGVATSIISAILTWRLWIITNIITSLVGLFVTALSIIGIVNVYNGKAKELPIVNKFKFIK